jgi:hypothetical protein
MDAPDIARVVALGASNLTRGLRTVVAAARAAWGADVEVLAALGHGRSYGAPSRLIFRTLPGILESGLWLALDSLRKIPTRALVTDVGNDILYGFSAARILEWIEEVLARLKRQTNDIILTDLPLARARRLSRAWFWTMRSIIVPSCRLSLAQALKTAEQVNTGLASLSTTHGIKLFRLKPEWYGIDPIHIRPSYWRSAWLEILGAHSSADNSPFEGLRLYFTPPERRRLFGIEQRTPQTGARLPAGGRLWLY